MKKKILFICFLFLFIGLFSYCLKSFAHSRINLNDYTVVLVSPDNMVYSQVEQREMLAIVGNNGDLYHVYLSYVSSSVARLRIYDANYNTLYTTDTWHKNDIIGVRYSPTTYLQFYRCSYNFDETTQQIESSQTALFYETQIYESFYINVNQRFILYQEDSADTLVISNVFNNYLTILNNGLGQINLNGYNEGYNDGYDDGYDDGQEGENAISPVFNILTHIFSTIGAIFSIELVPHVPIGIFFLVPLFFGVVGLILWIWRRN